MRLIDADALDEEVMHLFIAITGNPKQTTVVNECKRSFRQMIEDQPTVGEWIPVEERLPKWGERALTCDAKGNIHIMTELKIPGKPFGVGENHPRFFPVVAWMPLPEPYRPEGGE